MTLKRGFIASALFAATAAASIAVAPAALAAPTCTAVSSSSTQCESPGNAQITATPPYVNYQQQYPFFGEGGLVVIHHDHGR
jgi:hypothetical protein